MKFLAYYTSFAGSDYQCKGAWPAGRIPPVPSEKYDCYYFTNHRKHYEKIKATTKWIPIFVDKQHTNDDYDSNLIAKGPKVCPHHYKELQDYQYLVYQDTKMFVKSDDIILKTIEQFPNAAFIAREHFRPKKGVYDELEDSIQQGRYLQQKPQYEAYIEKQIGLGYTPNDSLHVACGFIIRNMTHPDIVKINELWLEHINECGIQDQISFYFVKQRFVGAVVATNADLVESMPLATEDMI